MSVFRSLLTLWIFCAVCIAQKPNFANPISASKYFPDLLEAIDESDDLDKAQTRLRNVLEKDPDYPYARIVLADTLYAHKKYPEAIAEYKIAASQREDYFRRRFPERKDLLGDFTEHINTGISRAYRDSGQLQQARSLLENAIAADPHRIKYRYELASVFVRMQDLKYTMGVLEEILKHEQEDEDEEHRMHVTRESILGRLSPANGPPREQFLEQKPIQKLFAEYGY